MDLKSNLATKIVLGNIIIPCPIDSSVWCFSSEEIASTAEYRIPYDRLIAHSAAGVQ